MQLKSLSLYMEQRTGVLLPSHQGVTHLIWLITALKSTKQSGFMNILVAIERIAELNYFANSDKVIQIVSEGNYYLIKCKRGGKKKKVRNTSLEGLSWVTLSPETQVTTSLGSIILNDFSLLPWQLLQGLPRTVLLPAPTNLWLIYTHLLSPQYCLLG